MPRTTPIDALSDPALVHDDTLTFDLSEMEAELCDKSTSGQCEYSMARKEWSND